MNLGHDASEFVKNHILVNLKITIFPQNQGKLFFFGKKKHPFP